MEVDSIYMIIAVIGVVVAIIENRPANAGGFSTGLPVVQDFLYGNGSAMSPQLYILIAQAIFTVLVPRRDPWGHLALAASLSQDCSWRRGSC